MQKKLDLVIVGSGPGGLTAGLLAQKKSQSYVIVEKGSQVMQGIIETDPKGKKVYPTIPKRYKDPFPADEIKPPDSRVPVEKYIEQINEVVDSKKLNLKFNETFKGISGEFPDYVVDTDRSSYQDSSTCSSQNRGS